MPKENQSTLRFTLILILFFSTILFVLSLVGPANQAQTPRPTPTVLGDGNNGGNNGGGSDSDDDDDDGPPLIVQSGTVRGYVYEYPSGAAIGDVMVVLDGGGWQAETTTDSQGFYEFAGLGEGFGVLNLRLPNNAASVAPNYPVNTGLPNPTNTNLGFYWGNTRPLPVRLSFAEATMTTPVNQDIILSGLVENRTDQIATSLTARVQLPSGLSVLGAQAPIGEVTLGDNEIIIQWDRLPAGETGTFNISARFNDARASETLPGYATLNYAEQLTPQAVLLSFSPGAAQEVVAAPAVAAAESPSVVPAPASQAVSGADDTTTAAAPSSVKTKDTETTTSTSASASAESSAALIPSTGGNTLTETPAWPLILFSIVLILGLSFGGLIRLIQHRTNPDA
jgi:hypothetical protein